jgi:hypothetical protein
MEKISLGKYLGRDVELSFDGEEVSTDGGLLLIDKINKDLNLTDKLSNTIDDTTDQDMINILLQICLNREFMVWLLAMKT